MLLKRNFPRGVAFHPHGIYLLRTESQLLLYVINHAYSEGGERIEVFSYETEEEITHLKYLYSLRQSDYFDKRAMGRLNDILVISEDEFYVTTYWPVPDDPVRGQTDLDRNIFSKLHGVAMWIGARYGLLNTYVYRCTVPQGERKRNVHVDCEI
jgi:hypothetical protein